MARQSKARQARRGKARPGTAKQGRRGTARPGRARQSKAGKARQGPARQGTAKQGRRGKARHGQAWQSKAGIATQGMAAIPVWRKQMSIANELKRILDRDGVLTPEAVVDEASEPSSPLHASFEWNDDKAAHAYRLEQARYLIRKVKVTITPDDGAGRPIRIRAYASTGPGEFVATVDALSDNQLRAKVLDAALKEMRAFKEKYRDLQELSGVLAAIDKTLKVAGD